MARVLKKGGYFVITDFRSKEAIAQLENDLQSFGLKLVKKEDITVNVTQALKLDEQRKAKWINDNTNALVRPYFRKFSGLSDTRIFQEFQRRDTIYMAYCLQKQ